MSRVLRSEQEETGTDGTAIVPTAPNKRSWLFYVLLGILAIPVLLFDIFPSQDGAAHLANGAIYNDVGESILDTYIDVQWFPLVPNILVDLVLGALLLVFPPFLAERIVVLALLVGLPLGLRFCLQQLGRVDSPWPALLAIPLGANFLLFFGFYGFLLGVTLSLFVLAYWLSRIRTELRPRDIVILASSMLLVYISHPVPLLVLIAFLAAASFDSWLETRRTSPSVANAKGRREALAVLAASAAPLVLLGVYAVDQQSTAFEYGRSLLLRLGVLPMDALVAFSNWEAPFAIAFSGGIALIGAAIILGQRRAVLRRPGYLITAIGLLGAYLVSPMEIGPGGVILQRIVLFATIASILWLGTLSPPRWVHTSVIVIAAVATIGLTLVRIPYQADFHDRLTEFTSAIPVLEAESTVLPLWSRPEQPPTPSRFDFPGKPWAGYLMAGANVVDLSHFPALVEGFPVAFQPAYDIQAIPGSEGGGFVLGGPLVNAPDYEVATPGEIDYVLIWGADDSGDLGVDDSPDIENWLATDYEPVFVSSPHGLLTIYERSR